ncbi:LAME_0B07602g1_1 [Lachancea meyersii CBS 8951]|uniref:DNA replication ATP-dependent helicase/nuclease DNA2 n=1 Tax=Lachancea meyersii CBS 8951 TaxID=1266667 RepID=A0A1G4IWT2_9SACH|nr:LAME_0B07602g1_1 [Lachancea meyersii CBS 8951]
MGVRNAKKRGPNHFASPERLNAVDESASNEKSSAVSSSTSEKAAKMKKRYKFTPIDKIKDRADKKESPPGLLRSIPVSQIRKSKVDDNSAPPREAVSIRHTKTSDKISTSGRKFEENTGRSEEVVWQYSPKKNPRSEGSDVDLGYRSLSEDSVLEQVVKESSTPIVPNKYRSVLNLPHMNNEQDHNGEPASLASRNPSLRQNSLPKSFDEQSPSRPSTRDIDEIIHDLEGQHELKPPFPAEDIPSSPISSYTQKLRARKDPCRSPTSPTRNAKKFQNQLLVDQHKSATTLRTLSLAENLRARRNNPKLRSFDPKQFQNQSSQDQHKDTPSLPSFEVTRVKIKNGEQSQAAPRSSPVATGLDSPKNDVYDVNKATNEMNNDNNDSENDNDNDGDNDKDNDNSIIQNDDDESYDEEDDDDGSLIKILTQKFGDSENHKIPEAASKNIQSVESKSDGTFSDDSGDDSLINLLHATAQNPKDLPPECSQREPEIDAIEQTFSQNVHVKDNELKWNEIIKDYVERAQFAVQRNDMERMVIVEIKDHFIKQNVRQKVLVCVDKESKSCNLVVRQPWVDLPFEQGDVVHTIPGQNCANKRLFSNDKEPYTGKINDNLLILNPDILLAATTIGRAVECQRKAIICTQFNGPGEPSLPALTGSIVHELLQACLQYKLVNDNLSDKFVSSKLYDLLEYHSADVTLCGTTKHQLSRQIEEDHLSNIKDFTRKYVRSHGPHGTPKSGTQITRNKVPFGISNIIDIEENIWSPMYGLKGFIDATVEAQFPNNSRFITPLELKTGKTKSISHEVQGSIYTLLLNDRYEVPVNFFLLFYTKSNDFDKQNTLLASIKHLLTLRNQVSTFLKHELKEINNSKWNGTILPPILRSSECDNCYSKTECMVLNKLCENGNAADSGLKDGEYEALTAHLSGNPLSYKEFYLKYEDLIVKEESSLNGINRKVFLVDSRTRESISGKCLSSLRIENIEEHKFTKNIEYTFSRKSGERDLPPMSKSQISKDEIVIISDEIGHFSLCTGRVTNISKASITVMTSRRLENNNIHAPGFEKSNNQTLRTVLMPAAHSGYSQNAGLSYRIDRNEVQRGMAMARFNLLNLFLPPIPEGTMTIDENGVGTEVKASLGGDIKTRELLVDGRAPTFRPLSRPPPTACDDCLKSKFNMDQQTAFDKVMRAEDFALILGMPGTGKTTLIVEIVKCLVECGKSILLTSYTHSAIDNILIKLKQCGIDIMRLGAKHRVHRETREFVVDVSGAETLNELLKITESAPVVATTCLNIYDTLLTVRRRDFDYVIVDEASQLSLPMCLGPLKFAPKFVLVGDHYQLPPLVKNEAARAGGLDESLFKILCEKYPYSVAELTHQYRMCQDVMALSNYLIYNGKLKCGNEMVRDQELSTPNSADLIKLQNQNASKPWLADVIDSKRKVVFLNHDLCACCQETGDRDNITNVGEAEVVWQCVAALVKSGVKRNDIGVMTLYRAQLRLLRAMFSAEEDAELETLTADQFQGRDKKCIIISMVRSNDGANGGNLLRELRRVNVAMTRAKAKLLIVGSKSTVGSVETISGFVDFLETRGWIYTLPSDCLECYNLVRNTQVGPMSPRVSGEPKPAGGITGDSKFARNKPVLRDILNGM